VAIVVAVYVQNHFGFNGFRVPFIGNVVYTQWISIPFTDRGVELGAIVFIVVAVIAIVGCSNGVNLTDGLDGLAGGTLVFAFISFLIIALLNQPLQPNLAMVNAIVIGALMGFLWFNVHPAQVFMGDSGALSLGGMLAVTALITGQVLILPLIGIIFVLEVASDVIQVTSYKLRGKRVFRMAPLHHHFELGGWDEEKITMRFWIVGALAGMLGVTLFVASIPK
jgi:phospho-N-acetylmuramoyl-pentapeptide-transferase